MFRQMAKGMLIGMNNTISKLSQQVIDNRWFKYFEMVEHIYI